MSKENPGTVAESVARAMAAAEAAGVSINITVRSKDWLGQPEFSAYPATAVLESIPDRLADQLSTIAGDDGMVTISITPKGHFDRPEFAEVDEAPPARAPEEGRDMEAMAIRAVDIGDKVKLAKSGEKGEVIGRSYFTRQPGNLYIEYVTGDGRQVKDWFDIEEVEHDNDPPARPTR